MSHSKTSTSLNGLELAFSSPSKVVYDLMVQIACTKTHTTYHALGMQQISMEVG